MKNEERTILIDIPRVSKLKINLKDKEKFFFDSVDKLKELDFNVIEKMYVSPQYFLMYSKSTYIAPAYYLNQYLDNIIEYNKLLINDHKMFEELYKSKFNIDVNSIFISIKILLDRLVTILSFYYKGIEIKGTFGRIKENGKATALMSIVLQLKETDSIMNFIYEQYNEWIKYAVEPRDMIIHHHDLGTNFIYPADGVILPEHYIINLFEELTSEAYDNKYKYNFLAGFVENLYYMIDSIILSLPELEYNFSRIHFKDKSYFKNKYEKSM
jgi:hypothetical protein